MQALIPVEIIEKKILLIRGEKVMLDADLAELYGVTTKRLNEQVKRNADRFPEDFAFQLTNEEWENLKTLNNKSDRSQFATGSQKHRDPRFLPRVFTEHGAIMASTVLNSKQAVDDAASYEERPNRVQSVIKEGMREMKEKNLLPNLKKQTLSKYTIHYALISAILITVVSCAPFIQPTSDPELQVVQETIQVIQKHYIDSVNEQDITNGAIRGMFNVANEQGKLLSPEALKAIEQSNKQSFKIISDTFHLIQASFDMKIAPQHLAHGAIKGIMRKVDPEGGLYSPDNDLPYSGGIGLEIAKRNNQIIVTAPIEYSPAERAGIQSGDIILKIDGKAVQDSTIFDVVQKLRGSLGTPVTLTIMRKEKDVFDLTLNRENIKIKAVKHKILEDKIGYIRIKNFHETTSYDLRVALKRMNDQDMKALILDLRNSPGGLFNQAVEICDLFLKKGELIATLKGREESIEYFAQKGSNYPNYPLVVIVNEFTAAGAEMVAAALQAWNRATIIGVKTFGRGSVQSAIPLSDGYLLRLTNARFFTPNGRSITGEGVTPDVVVEGSKPEDNIAALIHANQRPFGESKVDVQLQRAIAIIQKQ